MSGCPQYKFKIRSTTSPVCLHRSAIAFGIVTRKSLRSTRPIPCNEAAVGVDFTYGFATRGITASRGAVRLLAGSRRGISADSTSLDLKMPALSFETIINRAVITVVAARGSIAGRRRTITPRTKEYAKITSRDRSIQVKVSALDDFRWWPADLAEHQAKIDTVHKTITIKVLLADIATRFRFDCKLGPIGRDRAPDPPDLLVRKAYPACLPGIVHEVRDRACVAAGIDTETVDVR